MLRRPSCQKTLEISNITVEVAPDLLKVLAILPDATAGRSAVGWVNLKLYWKAHFFRWSTILLFTRLTKKTNKAVVFSYRLFPNILKYREHQWNLQTIWKTRFFRTHIEEFRWYVWKSRQSIPLEPPLEYNQHQMPLMNDSLLWPF